MKGPSANERCCVNWHLVHNEEQYKKSYITWPLHIWFCVSQAAPVLNAYFFHGLIFSGLFCVCDFVPTLEVALEKCISEPAQARADIFNETTVETVGRALHCREFSAPSSSANQSMTLHVIYHNSSPHFVVHKSMHHAMSSLASGQPDTLGAHIHMLNLTNIIF